MTYWGLTESNIEMTAYEVFYGKNIKYHFYNNFFYFL